MLEVLAPLPLAGCLPARRDRRRVWGDGAGDALCGAGLCASPGPYRAAAVCRGSWAILRGDLLAGQQAPDGNNTGRGPWHCPFWRVWGVWKLPQVCQIKVIGVSNLIHRLQVDRFWPENDCSGTVRASSNTQISSKIRCYGPLHAGK